MRKEKALKIPPVFEVQWLDAHMVTMSGAFFANEIVEENPPMVLNNVGYLVHTDEKQTFLAAMYDHSTVDRPGELIFRDVMVIPTAHILKKRRLL